MLKKAKCLKLQKYISLQWHLNILLNYTAYAAIVKAITHRTGCKRVTQNSTFFLIETYCVMYKLTKGLHFAENLSSKNSLKKMKVTSSDKMVLIFLNKKRKKLRFWVHLQPGSSREMVHGLIQELNLYHACCCAYFSMLVGQFEILFAELGPTLSGHREITSESWLTWRSIYPCIWGKIVLFHYIITIAYSLLAFKCNTQCSPLCLFPC